MPRPKKRINADQVRKLSSIGCTAEEIGRIYGVAKATIQNRFPLELQRGRGDFQGSLRRKQFIVAMSGNPTMLIWLGKQHLEQSEEKEAGDEGDSVAEQMARIADALQKRDGDQEKSKPD